MLKPVIACYAVAGDANFLLQVVAEDLDSFSTFAISVIRRLAEIILPRSYSDVLTIKNLE